MLNNDTIPPHEDMAYESLLEMSKQGIAESKLFWTPFFKKIPVFGVQCSGATLAVTF